MSGSGVSTPVEGAAATGPAAGSEAGVVPLRARLPCFELLAGYSLIDELGSGKFGRVFRARHQASGRIVALKRLLTTSTHDGFPRAVLREVSALRALRHVNVIKMLGVVSTPDMHVYLAFEYAEYDLAAMLDAMPDPLPESAVKSVLRQLLLAVKHLHAQRIVHRDIKMSNILMTEEGVIKLADFGLARTLSTPQPPLSPVVVTLWYRCPELLLGSSRYSDAVDIWSVGCVFAELLRHRPLLPGTSELDQLRRITQLLGTPHVGIWPELPKLAHVREMLDPLPYQQYCRVNTVFPHASPYAIDLMLRMLAYDPERRITAEAALEHPYLTLEQPRPIPAAGLGRVVEAAVSRAPEAKRQRRE